MDANPVRNFPGYTEWSAGKFCCIYIETIPSLRLSFWRHWEIRPIVPILVILLSLSSLVVIFRLVMPHFGLEGMLVSPVIAVLFLLFLLNYIRVITDGPGYFPFYWAFRDVLPPPPSPNALLLSRDETPDGIISTDEQHQWAHAHRKPPRSILSKTARRMVLRPDHFCAWAAVWIGKRNEKFFILLNFYSLLYLIFFVLYVARHFVNLLSATVNLTSFVLAAYGLGAAAFALVNATFFLTSLCDAMRNRTSWEQWNEIDGRFDQGIRRNLEDVCGPVRRWWAWPLPISPWNGQSSSDLAAEYVSYYE
jgi:hypothetical protein